MKIVGIGQTANMIRLIYLILLTKTITAKVGQILLYVIYYAYNCINKVWSGPGSTHLAVTNLKVGMLDG